MDAAEVCFHEDEVYDPEADFMATMESLGDEEVVEHLKAVFGDSDRLADLDAREEQEQDDVRATGTGTGSGSRSVDVSAYLEMNPRCRELSGKVFCVAGDDGPSGGVHVGHSEVMGASFYKAVCKLHKPDGNKRCA